MSAPPHSLSLSCPQSERTCIERLRALTLLIGALSLGLTLGWTHTSYAQCSEPELEESVMLEGSALEMISPEDALSRDVGEWRLSDHVSGG